MTLTLAHPQLTSTSAACQRRLLTCLTHCFFTFYFYLLLFYFLLFTWDDSRPPTVDQHKCRCQRWLLTCLTRLQIGPGLPQPLYRSLYEAFEGWSSFSLCETFEGWSSRHFPSFLPHALSDASLSVPWVSKMSKYLLAVYCDGTNLSINLELFATNQQFFLFFFSATSGIMSNQLTAYWIKSVTSVC